MVLWRTWFRRNGLVHKSVVIGVDDIRPWAKVISSIYNPQTAEALAILKGLQFAKDSGLWHCAIETDAQAVVNLIGSDNIPLSDVGLIISDILFSLC
ncbi:hypothetical protein Q3G72_006651 [Acer saccharum]|nr:hypothetical protein Q3G72_006651 [Acer saccharum]